MYSRRRIFIYTCIRSTIKQLDILTIFLYFIATVLSLLVDVNLSCMYSTLLFFLLSFNVKLNLYMQKNVQTRTCKSNFDCLLMKTMVFFLSTKMSEFIWIQDLSCIVMTLVFNFCIIKFTVIRIALVFYTQVCFILSVVVFFCICAGVSLERFGGFVDTAKNWMSYRTPIHPYRVSWTTRHNYQNRRQTSLTNRKNR